MSLMLVHVALVVVPMLAAVEGINAVSIGPVSLGGGTVGVNQHALLKINVDIEFTGWQDSDNSPDSLLHQKFQEGVQWIVSIDEVSLPSQPLSAPSLTSQHPSSQQLFPGTSSSLATLLEMEQILSLNWSRKYSTLHGSSAVSFLFPLEEDSGHPKTSSSRTLVVAVWEETLSVNIKKRKRLLARRLAHVPRTKTLYERPRDPTIPGGDVTETAPGTLKHYTVVDISASSRCCGTSSSRLIQPAWETIDPAIEPSHGFSALALGVLLAVAFHVTRHLFGFPSRKNDPIISPGEDEIDIRHQAQDQEEETSTVVVDNEEVESDYDPGEEVESKGDRESHEAQDHEDDEWWPGDSGNMEDERGQCVVENTEVLLSWPHQRNPQNSGSSTDDGLDLPPPVERHVVRPMPTHGITFEAEIERFNSLNLLSPLGSRMTRSSTSSGGQSRGRRVTLNLGSPTPLSWDRPMLFNSPGPARRYTSFAQIASSNQAPELSTSKPFNFNGFQLSADNPGAQLDDHKLEASGHSSGTEDIKNKEKSEFGSTSSKKKSPGLTQPESTQQGIDKACGKTDSSRTTSDADISEPRGSSRGGSSEIKYYMATVTRNENDSERLSSPEAGIVRSVSLEDRLNSPVPVAGKLAIIEDVQTEKKKTGSASAAVSYSPMASQSFIDPQKPEETPLCERGSSSLPEPHCSGDDMVRGDNPRRHMSTTSNQECEKTLPLELQVADAKEKDLDALDQSISPVPGLECFAGSKSSKSPTVFDRSSPGKTQEKATDETVFQPDIPFTETASSFVEIDQSLPILRGAGSQPTEALAQHEDSGNFSLGADESSGNEVSKEPDLQKILPNCEPPSAEIDPASRLCQPIKGNLLVESGKYGKDKTITPTNQCPRKDGADENIVTEESCAQVESHHRRPKDHEPQRLDYDGSMARTRAARRGHKRPRASLEMDDDLETGVVLEEPRVSVLSNEHRSNIAVPTRSSVSGSGSNSSIDIFVREYSASTGAQEHGTSNIGPSHGTESDAGESAKKTYSSTYALTLSPNTYTSDEHDLSPSETAITKISCDCPAEPNALGLKCARSVNESFRNKRPHPGKDDSIRIIGTFPISNVLVTKRRRQRMETEAMNIAHSEVLPEIVPSISLVTVSQNVLAPVWEFRDNQGNTNSKRNQRKIPCNTIVRSNGIRVKPIGFTGFDGESAIQREPLGQDEAGVSQPYHGCGDSTISMSIHRDLKAVPADSPDEPNIQRTAGKHSAEVNPRVCDIKSKK